MKRFLIEAPGGRKITVEGENEPNDDEVEDIIKDLERADFEPSMVRHLASVMRSMVKQIEALRNPEAPVVNVAAPIINVEAEKRPKTVRFRVTERDEFGRMLEVEMKAE